MQTLGTLIKQSIEALTLSWSGQWYGSINDTSATQPCPTLTGNCRSSVSWQTAKIQR